MYCSHCGTQASGNFCAACGTRLAGAAAPSGDWRREVRYHVLLHFPEVRDMIAASAAQAPRAGMTGEAFLELGDKAFQPLAGVSLSTVQSIAVPIYTRLGIQTGKARSQAYREPPGAMLVAAICSLARRRRELTQVHQGEDGCVLEAAIPSDWRSFAGTLLVSVARGGEATILEATAKIPGQLYDWGKSAQCLSELFADLQTSEPRRLAS
jgi:hypothetical protein